MWSRLSKLILSSACVLITTFEVSAMSQEEAQDLAQRMYARLTGIPLSDPDILAAMMADIMGGNPELAAFRAIDDDNMEFYKTTLVNMFTPLAKNPENVLDSLTDFTATIVGLVRDNRPFHEVLTGDVMYIARDELMDYAFLPPYGAAATDTPHFEIPAANIDVAADTFTIPGHGLYQAELVEFLNTAPGNFSTGTVYRAIIIDANTIRLAVNSVSQAVEGIARDVTNVAAGTVYQLEERERDLTHISFAGAYTARSDDPVFRDPVTGDILAVSTYIPVEAMVRPPFFAANDNGNDNRYRSFNHYNDLTSRYLANWPELLSAHKQSELYSVLGQADRIPAEDVMGVVTSREFVRSAATAGTNRRFFSFVMDSFYCKPMEEIKDTTAPETRIREDVSRNPSGNAQLFKNECKGCHAGMDGMVGAFTYFDFDTNDGGRMKYNSNGPQGVCNQAVSSNGSGVNKQLRQCLNAPAPLGYHPSDNSWKNYWSVGPNASFNWRSPSGSGSISQGVGARELGQTLGAAKQFSRCMTQRVFKRVCQRNPVESEKGKVAGLVDRFEYGFSELASENADGPYNLRALFAMVTDLCMNGDQ